MSAFVRLAHLWGLPPSGNLEIQPRVCDGRLSFHGVIIVESYASTKTREVKEAFADKCLVPWAYLIEPSACLVSS